MRRPNSLRINYHADSERGVPHKCQHDVFFFSAAGAMRDGRRRGGTAAKTDGRTHAGHDVLRGQRWPVDKRCQTCLRTACDCLPCLMGSS